MTEYWYSNRTQICWTCWALVQGRTITHMDEIGEVQGWRLGAIVHTLRSKYAWPIDTEYRGPERLAPYRLSGRCDLRALEFPKSAIGLREELQDEGCGCTQAEGEGAQVPDVPRHG